MPELTFAQSLNAALREEMQRDGSVVLIGEDVAAYGGVYTVSRGLLNEFGAKRVRDTPISESAFVGLAVGAAMTGMRPVVEVMYMDFMLVAADPIMNQAATEFRISNGTGQGHGRSEAKMHDQSNGWEHLSLRRLPAKRANR